jgi:hypothetical protein
LVINGKPRILLFKNLNDVLVGFENPFVATLPVREPQGDYFPGFGLV